MGDLRTNSFCWSSCELSYPLLDRRGSRRRIENLPTLKHESTMTLGIGVIGTGIMGADHVETITAAISGAEVRAIADIDLKRAEVIASRVPGAKALSSAESLIELPEVDGVIIASSDATHARYVSASIAARKPILCEKPLAPTVAECEEILRLEQAAGFRVVQVGFMRRFDPPPL